MPNRYALAVLPPAWYRHRCQTGPAADGLIKNGFWRRQQLRLYDEIISKQFHSSIDRFCIQIRSPKPSLGIVTGLAGQLNDLKHMAGGSIMLNELHRKATNWAKIVDEIVRLEKKIFPKHESLARSFDDELKKKNGGLLYMEIDADVVGYVMYSCPSSLCAIITKLAVKENHRRQGHGEALLKAAIEKCRSKSIHRVSLHVDPLRTSAMHLYKKLGFQIDTLVKGYYSSDRDAYRMYIDFDKD